MESLSKISVLLPFCLEFESDVFLNVVNNLMARAQLDSHFIDKAFKDGMSGVQFPIEVGDVTVDWLQQNSDEQKIRQAKLLGYWASANFPILGKKFYGLQWKPPQRFGFQVDGYTEQISAAEIDAMVFKKLKIRLLEIDAPQSTKQKLIRFVVDIPTDLRKVTETVLPRNIKSFDVDEESGVACWKALQLASQRSQSASGPQRKVSRNNGNNENPIGPKQVKATKRMHFDQNENSSKPTTCSKSPKRAHLDVHPASNGFNGNNTDGSSFDPITAALFEIKSEVGGLTDLVRAALSERESESTNSQDGLYLLIVNQKDDEIARLKASSQELIQSNRTLTNDQLVLKEQNDRQFELINALQKGVESTSKLQLQAEHECTRNLNAIEALKNEITKLNAENRDFAEVKQDLAKLSRESEHIKSENDKLILENRAFVNRFNTIMEAEQEMVKLRAENQQLREERCVLNGEINVMDQMKQEMKQLKTENQETKKENELLQNELDVLSKETVCQMAELKSALDELRFSSPETISKSDMETQTEYLKVGVDIGSVDFVSESNGCHDKIDNDIERNGHHSQQNNTDHKDTIVPDNNAQNCMHQSTSEPKFVTDDIIVIKCRDVLQKLKFGWMKFQPTKNAKFSPGFVHPADPDGIERAQKVTASGYVSDEKNEFFDFAENISDEKKNKAGKTALKKLNQNFKFSHL